MMMMNLIESLHSLKWYCYILYYIFIPDGIPVLVEDVLYPHLNMSFYDYLAAVKNNRVHILASNFLRKMNLVKYIKIECA